MILQLLFVSCAIGLIYILTRTKENRGKLPPGPFFRFPILGHLPLLGARPPETFVNWGKNYGPIFSVQLGSFPAIIINDYNLIRKAFNLNAFAGRPDIKLFNKISGERKGFLFADGHKALEQRKITQTLLKNFGYGGHTMETLTQEHIPKVLGVFEAHLSKPLKVKHAFNHSILSVLWNIVAGEMLEQNDPRFLRMVQHVCNIADMSTFFEKLAVFVKEAATFLPELSRINPKHRGMLELQKYFNGLIKNHEEDRVAGRPRDIIDGYLDDVEKTSDPSSSYFADHGHCTIILQDLFMGGVETTSTLFEWVLFYMAKYPEIQEKLHQEVRKVLGPTNIPSTDDRAKLPYTCAVIQEITRIVSPFPISLPHDTLEDTEFAGYLIPKGTMIIGNVYAAHFDKEFWGDPEVFRPERFLNEQGKLIKKDALMPFGVGKRKCVGTELARLQLFLFAASTFQQYHVELCGEPQPGKPFSSFINFAGSFQLKVSKCE